MWGLETIGGTMLISNNSTITRIAQMDALHSVGGGLLVLNNPNLDSYCGLINILDGFKGIFSAVGNTWNPTQSEILLNCTGP